MKNYNRGFMGIGLILAIILGAGVIGGGAYYLQKNTKNIPTESIEWDGNGLPESFLMEMKGEYSSSGAGRNYQGELTFKNSEVISGFQIYNVSEGGTCKENCNRKTECVVNNHQWVDKTTGGECMIDTFSSPLTREGILQKINEGKYVQVEDINKCNHGVTCYQIKNKSVSSSEIKKEVPTQKETPVKKTPGSFIPSLFGGLTVPKYVSVFLSSSVENGESVPVLQLSAVASGGCGTVSNLELQKQINNDTLNVDIKGYEFKKSLGQGICSAVLVQSLASVTLDLNWLKQGGEKEIIFKLDGVINKYKISYNKYKVTLSGIQATNVSTYEEYTSQAPRTQEVILYPLDVAIMYLAGSGSYNKDFIPMMRDFAKAKGMIPADDVYDGIEQNEKTRLYVVLKNYPRPSPGRPELLGGLPGGEGISVYLKNVYFIK